MTEEDIIRMAREAEQVLAQMRGVEI